MPKTSKRGLILAEKPVDNLEVVKQTPEQVKESSSIETLISQAIENKTSVETMERLFNLRKEVKAEQAKEMFVAALSAFQGELPVIQKTKPVKNKEGKVIYMFAPIDSIVEQTKDLLKKHGISYTWKSENKEKSIKVTAIVTHILGHSEYSDVEIPIDDKAFMTAPQKVASALTFAKRYALCNALGISTGDEDTDGTDVNKDKNAKSKQARIIFLLRELGYNDKTNEEYKTRIQSLVQLDLIEANFDDIEARLSLLVDQKNEAGK